MVDDVGNGATKAKNGHHDESLFMEDEQCVYG